MNWETLLVVLLAGVYALGIHLSPFFLARGNQADIIATQMERALIVLPVTLIIIAGEIDLSVASIAGLASAVLAVAMNWRFPFELALLAALAAGLLCGILNGVLIAYFALPSMVVTVATLAIFRGVAFIILGGDAATAFPEWFTTFGFERIGRLPLPWTVALFVPLAFACAVLLHATVFGRRLRALGAQPEVARFSGIEVRRIKASLYMLSGIISALAGLVLTARISSARADNAVGWELPIIAAVLLGGVSIYGGRGTVLGPILAVFIFGCLGNALGLANVSTQLLQIIVGGVLVASVLLTNMLARRAGRTGGKPPLKAESAGRPVAEARRARRRGQPRTKSDCSEEGGRR